MRILNCTVCLCMAIMCVPAANAQLLKKLKEKAEAITNTATGNNNTATSGNNTSTSGTSSKNNPSNKGGQGLVVTPPDVVENLASAETSFKAASYGDTRYAVQQAMLGVELQIGQSILKSLPDVVAGLKKDTTSDQVASTSWGWTGLTIHREYNAGDKQLRLTIANNAVWMQAVNMYLSNGGYAAQSNNGKQNWKQTKLKDNRAVIEYEESSGYKLSVPLGQTSLLVFEGVNFASEQDMMAACSQINLDSIKKSLGEK